MTTTAATKFCGSCETDLPREAFDLDLRRKDGRKASCRKCRAARATEVDQLVKG